MSLRPFFSEPHGKRSEVLDPKKPASLSFSTMHKSCVSKSCQIIVQERKYKFLHAWASREGCFRTSRRAGEEGDLITSAPFPKAPSKGRSRGKEKNAAALQTQKCPFFFSPCFPLRNEERERRDGSVAFHLLLYLGDKWRKGRWLDRKGEGSFLGARERQGRSLVFSLPSYGFRDDIARTTTIYLFIQYV